MSEFNTFDYVSLKTHREIVQDMRNDADILRTQSNETLATNSALAERVQALEAALDKAADDVAFLRNRLDIQAEQDAAALRDAQGDAARLRAALEEVEWVDQYDPFCPWCKNDYAEGHRPDCQRQTALAQTSEVKA